MTTQLLPVLLLSISPAVLAGETVPFVGCECNTQTDPRPAPRGSPKQTIFTPEKASRLAYYFAQPGIGVLAPRGWQCRGFWGSSGYTLIVAPEKVTTPHDDGPAVRISVAPTDNSGRYDVA